MNNNAPSSAVVEPSHPASNFVFWAAPFSPFSTDRSEVCYDVIPAQAQHLIQCGVDGAFICGTTGEGFSLSISERKKIAEHWIEAAGSQLKVIVHVGHTCVESSQELCQHAQSIGAYGVAAMGPTFFSPTNSDALVEMMAQIANSCDLPFFYYHMPSMANVPGKLSEFLPKLIETITNFAGVKYTYEDLDDFRECVQISNGQYQMLFGRDEIMLEGVRLGADGAVGSTYNFNLDVYRAILDAFHHNDLVAAASQQQKAQGYIDLFLKYGSVNAAKALMKMCGVDCGPPRLPLAALSPAQYQEMHAEFLHACFF